MMQMARQLSLALTLLACALGLPCAHADVYVWVDPSGNVNVSNLTPPEDARITSVIPTLQKTAAQVEADREAAHRAEFLALNERISRLQEEVEQSRRQAPPVSYVYAAPPPPPQFSSWTPPDISYAMDAPPQWSIDCSWPNYCGGGWGAWGYPAPIVVIGGGDFRRGGPRRGERPVAPMPHHRAQPRAVTRRG
jgi:hypothetical protein